MGKAPSARIPMAISCDEPQERREQASPDVSCWSSVEDYTKRHDSSFVDVYSDDINTLLVFAGLFSAVLTAFVSIACTLLQPDQSEPIVQRLDKISSQLESFVTPSASVRPTSQPIFVSSRFAPSNSARWINILWLLALVFSLAAALFGILAKQWLREYMQWDSALGTPRDNILIRQIRFEAWNDWHVSATISSIPALLELALVMFLIGLLIFLWDLDPVVAVVITVAVGLFLAIAIVLTITPAFWKRCPYKSPTAWAFLIFWRAATRLAKFIFTWCQSMFQNGLAVAWTDQTQLRCELWSSMESSWRQRDLDGARADSRFHFGGKGEQVIVDAFRQEQADDPFFPGWSLPRLHGYESFSADSLSSLDHSVTLFRALSWVSLASQALTLQLQMTECAKSLYDSGVKQMSSQMFSMWYILEKSRRSASSSPSDALSSSRFISNMRRALWSQYGIAQEGVLVFLRRDPWDICASNRDPELQFENHWPNHEIPILLSVLVHNISLLMVSLGEVLQTSRRIPLIDGGARRKAPRARRIVEMLCLFHDIMITPSLDSSSLPAFTQSLMDVHNAAFQGAHQSAVIDAEYPGLRTVFFQLVQTLQSVDLQDDETRLILSKNSGSHSTLQSDICGRLIDRLVDSLSESDLHRREQIHLTATLVHTSFHDLLVRFSNKDHGPRILKWMTTLVQFCRRNDVRHCGHHANHLPWLKTLAENDFFWLRDLQRRHDVLVTLLLRELHASLCAGLVEDEALLRRVLRFAYVPGSAYVSDTPSSPTTPSSAVVPPQQERPGDRARMAYVWQLDDWFNSLRSVPENPTEIRQVVQDITNVVASLQPPLNPSNNIMFASAVCFPWYDTIMAKEASVRDIIHRHAYREFLELVTALMELDREEERRKGNASPAARLELEELERVFSPEYSSRRSILPSQILKVDVGLGGEGHSEGASGQGEYSPRALHLETAMPVPPKRIGLSLTMVDREAG